MTSAEGQARAVDVLLAHGFFLCNDAKQLKKMTPYPPLGTLYAAALLRREGYVVEIFDAMFENDVGAFAEALTIHRPKIVAIYEDMFHFLNKMCLTHVRDAGREMARLAQARATTVVAAGADVTDHPEVFLGHGVDIGIVGEGDHALLEVVRHLIEGEGCLAEIPGLVLLDERGDLQRTPPRSPEREPDRFPHPAWDLLEVAPYRKAWKARHGYFSLNMVTTRGCPFHCNWCAKPIWGQRYAMRSPADVADEMAWLKRRLQPDHLWFADDIFGLKHRWVEEFADEVDARDAAIPFMIQSRVDLMRPKAVAALARAGCVEVWLGVESGSQKILDAMDKGTRVELVPDVRERLRKAGIRCCFFLQLGYPGETFEDLMTTVELVRSTLPDEIGVSVSYPLPGTKFHRRVATELVGQDHWQESNDLAMMFQGTYTTPFYRKFHQLLHLELDSRRRWSALDSPPPDETAHLESQWQELHRLERSCRSQTPTRFMKTYPQPESPDLSRGWT